MRTLLWAYLWLMGMLTGLHLMLVWRDGWEHLPRLMIFAACTALGTFLVRRK